MAEVHSQELRAVSQASFALPGIFTDIDDSDQLVRLFSASDRPDGTRLVRIFGLYRIIKPVLSAVGRVGPRAVLRHVFDDAPTTEVLLGCWYISQRDWAKQGPMGEQYWGIKLKAHSVTL